MSTNVVAAERGAPIGELAELLTRERISAVPIVANNGRLVDIVSEATSWHESRHRRIRAIRFRYRRRGRSEPDR
ncbi:CBS domain-containing protein [Jidongwangia harbinensis]|uniref:CBS domain-containing protein n=1 Tax=Jidongwangia harbinensis TaxID=2878561 RepID=UPI001CD9C980|nr:CBS domain-containing protein [Jidongwangia harbinensis]MCA2218902.1 CBS domain-containing protein [Jidongwangia harbinensis]